MAYKSKNQSNNKVKYTDLPEIVGAYCRISTDRQLENTSIQVQKERATSYSDRIGWKCSLFVDEGFSGSLIIDERPALLDLITQVKQGKIGAIYLSHLDRLSRDFYNSIGLFEIIKLSGVKLIIDDKETDVEDPSQKFQLNIIAAVAEMERARIRQRTMSGSVQAIKNGLYIGTLPALGYTTDVDRKLIVDDYESKIVEIMYTMCLDGKSCIAIANFLNENGYKTKKQRLREQDHKLGKVSVKRGLSGDRKETTVTLFREKTVHQILKNSLYKGLQKYGDAYYPAPAIIDENVWEAVQELLNNKVGGRTNKVNLVLLKSLIKCTVCGQNYYHKVDKNTNMYCCLSTRFKKEKCGNTGLGRPYLDRIVWDSILSLPEKIKAFIDKFEKNDGLKTTAKNLKDFDAQRDEWIKMMDNARMMLLKGVITEDEYLKTKAEHTEFLELYNMNQDMFLPDLNILKNKKDTLNYVNGIVAVAKKAKTDEEKRKVIVSLVDSIAIHNKHTPDDRVIQIFYKINNLTQYRIGDNVALKYNETGVRKYQPTTTNFTINSIVDDMDIFTFK